jgi:tetratricopeptide (TPR) repeat protein
MKETKDYQQAEFWGKKACEYQPAGSEFWCNLGEIYYNIHNIEFAIKSYNQALKTKIGETMFIQQVNFYHYRPNVDISKCYLALKDYKQAKYHVEQALKQHPESKEALNLLGTIDSELLLNSHNTSPSGNISIKWLLPGFDRNNPSQRLRNYNLNRELLKRGYVNCNIVHNYLDYPIENTRAALGCADAVVFSSCTEKDLTLCRYLKLVGIYCIFNHCEALFHYPGQDLMFNEVDMICCCSTKLEEMTKAQGFNNTITIKDIYE